MIVCVAVVGQQASLSPPSKNDLFLYLFVPSFNSAFACCGFCSMDHHLFILLLFFSYLWTQNNPLFIKSFTDGEDELKFHHIVHCSLDVIEEKGMHSHSFCFMLPQEKQWFIWWKESELDMSSQSKWIGINYDFFLMYERTLRHPIHEDTRVTSIYGCV